MTEKDFIKFAQVIKDLRQFDIEAAQYAFSEFCWMCAYDNYNFRRDTFEEACGLTDEQLNHKEAIGKRRVVRKFFIPAAERCRPSAENRKLG